MTSPPPAGPGSSVGAQPARDPASEDDFVARWRSASEGDDGGELLALVIAAVEAKRPTLAARLVGLLELDEGDDLHPAVLRAQRAASLLLRAGGEAAITAFTQEIEGLRSPMFSRAHRRLRRGGLPRDPRRGRR
jgi:hypothetical protein